jgi:WD40 repeat protein
MLEYPSRVPSSFSASIYHSIDSDSPFTTEQALSKASIVLMVLTALQGSMLKCTRWVQVVVAGSTDGFQIYVWAVKTGRLLDVLAAHEGPVVAVAFSPTQPLLASASWDKTVRTWDIFRCNPRPAF